jgi:hypothetical protein
MSADAQVRARVAQFVTTVWDGLGSYRDADIERFIRAVVPVVLGGQRQVVALTDSYLATIAAQTLGGPTRVAGVRLADVTGAALRGVAPTEVYRRPGVDVWTALSKGKSLVDAVNAGRRRALNLASTDLQLAKTHTARSIFRKDSRVVGHRRTLSGSEDCGMCVVASTQRYHKESLQPIHGGCDCGVEPIYGDRDPGQVIDEQTLSEAHGAIQDRFGVSSDGARSALDYRKVLLVREHGELGPVLTVKGQNFTGPSDF